ncbi:MAG TPA: aminopeptidase P family N-terminal domain-containing protein, partial [Armatimonadota bacterium]|nr:aminopeptidase P family N-terminal domain-containing protein [Armatimonadota bacterium]
MSGRIERLRAELRKQELPAMLLLNPLDVGYLSGFTGSTAALVVTPERAVFITDSRYVLQAQRECPGFELAVTEGSGAYEETIASEARRLGLAELGVESEFVTMARFEQLREKLEGIALRPASGVAGPLRRVKDAEEIARIREACALADRTFEFALTLLKPGAVEREIAADMDHFMRRHGAEKEGFDTIVVSGARSAFPHGRPSEKALEMGDLVT